jgi:hypothetical protein
MRVVVGLAVFVCTIIAPITQTAAKPASDTAIEAARGLHEAASAIDLALPDEKGIRVRDAHPPISVDKLCNTLVSAARAHELPISLFSNLIWQESRFDPDAVSPAGALGVAQFMPATAADEGLADPFDPLPALSASARFLRRLVEQFGNHGLAAAAYNAGAGTVGKWLAKKRKLPQETRGYVRSVTGEPAEQWRRRDRDTAAFALAKRMPCRRNADFMASLEAAGEHPPPKAKTARKKKEATPKKASQKANRDKQATQQKASRNKAANAKKTNRRKEANAKKTSRQRGASTKQASRTKHAAQRKASRNDQARKKKATRTKETSKGRSKQVSSKKADRRVNKVGAQAKNERRANGSAAARTEKRRLKKAMTIMQESSASARRR